MLEAQALSGGFANPVMEAQSVFRRVMDAMSRPGTIQTVSTSTDGPGCLSPAQAAIALTLLDHETPVWFAPSIAKSSVNAWVAFHSGATCTQIMSDARFAFLGKADPLPDFIGFEQGAQDYPDRSATLIMEVEALEGGSPLFASGPGVNGSATIAPVGLPADFTRRWKANHAVYPRGVDIILTADRHFIGLPRSLSLTKTEA